MNTIGEKLQELRYKAGLNQSQLCKLSGVRQQTISRIEYDHCLPNATTINKLAKALNCTATDIVGEIDKYTAGRGQGKQPLDKSIIEDLKLLNDADKIEVIKLIATLLKK